MEGKKWILGQTKKEFENPCFKHKGSLKCILTSPVDSAGDAGGVLKR